MVAILESITATLREIIAETFHEVNPKDTLLYPYATFTISTQELDRNMEDIMLEIDIFDRGLSNKGLLEVAGELKDHLKYKRELTDKLLLVYRFQSEADIPTTVSNLRRHSMTFGVRTAYRSGYNA
jgi:hypothetical protein